MKKSNKKNLNEINNKHALECNNNIYVLKNGQFVKGGIWEDGQRCIQLYDKDINGIIRPIGIGYY